MAASGPLIEAARKAVFYWGLNARSPGAFRDDLQHWIGKLERALPPED